MKNQKLHRGNLVEVLFGHPIWEIKEGKTITTDMSPEIVGKKAVIEENNDDDYSLIFIEDGGSQAWFSRTQLKFIDKGGAHLFKQAEKNRKIIEKRETDINYIKDNLDGSLSSTSVLTLFSLLNHSSAYLRNGEYYALVSDWYQLQPCFLFIRDAKTLEEAKAIFTEKGNIDYNVEAVYNAFHT